MALEDRIEEGPFDGSERDGGAYSEGQGKMDNGFDAD